MATKKLSEPQAAGETNGFHPATANNNFDGGGYDYEFVDPVPDECTCPICTLVQRDPQQVTCCGKIYCLSCLDILKGATEKFDCPSCRSSLGKEGANFFPDKNTNSKIIHLRIQCVNKGRGCQWVGLLKELQSKHIPDCPHELVKCTNKKNGTSRCGKKVERRELKTHMAKKCGWRIVSCSHCKEKGAHNYITGEGHVGKCPDVQLPCGNEDCTAKIKRRSMKEHHDSCPKEILPCQYQFLGCERKLKREELHTHYKEQVEDHFNESVKKLTEAVARIGKLEEALKKVKSGVVIKLSASMISPEFYVYDGGHKIIVRSEGFNKTGKHLLVVCIAVVPGQYDDLLKWPSKGTVQIELLNQEADCDHLVMTHEFEFIRPYPSEDPIKWLWIGECTPRPQHRNDDGTCYFRVTTKSDTEPKLWLV